MKPSLDDINISFFAISDVQVLALDDAEFRALMMIVAGYAETLVWTMTEPRHDGLPIGTLQKLAGLSSRRWQAVWSNIERFFLIHNDRVFLAHPWVTIGGAGYIRPALPASIRSFVIQRDGYRCIYCGSGNGPFEIDHIIPISKGGAPLDVENLATSCAACNGAKAAKMLCDWIGEHR